MKKLFHSIIFLLLTVLVASAGFIWSPEEGLSAKGPIAEFLVGKNINIHSAEEAMDIAQAENEAENYRNAISLYKKVFTEYKHSSYAPKARFEAGKLYMKRHQYTEAFNTLKDIIIDYPNFSQFNDVIAIQFDIAARLKAGKRPYYWGIIPGFRDYEKSIEYFESIVANAPYTKFAPMALMNIADLAKEHKKPEDVIDALDRLVSYYKESELAPTATLKLAEAYMSMVPSSEYEQGATRSAINHYEDFLVLYPNDPQVEQAEKGLTQARDKYARSKLNIGNFYYRYRNNSKAARIFYNEAISIAPESKASEQAQVMIDKLDQGILAPKTPVDIVFGRYEPISTPAYLDELEMEHRDNVKFATHTEEITLGTKPKDRLEDFYVEDPNNPNDDTPPHYEEPLSIDNFKLNPEADLEENDEN